jgi:hypothetical protein
LFQFQDFRIKEIDVIVLKYALCVGWIDLANYGDIVKGLEYLKDIEENHASKFPAVFYGLGSAYYKLNRYVFSFTPVRGFGYMYVEMSG